MSLEPENPDALHLLGVIATGAKRFEEAQGLIERALAAQPDTPDFLNSLGNALSGLGAADAAEASYRRAIDLGSIQALGNLGNLLAAQGRAEEAEARYRRLLAHAPNPAIQGNLGSVLMAQGRLQEAAACFRKVLEAAPEDPMALNNLGNALQDLGDAQAARDLYRRALAQAPDRAEIHHNLGNALFRTGALIDAVAAHRRALEIDPDHAGAAAMLTDLLMRVCDWEGRARAERRLDALNDAALAEGRPVAEPPLLNVVRCMEPRRNLEIVRSWLSGTVEARPLFDFAERKDKDGPLTVGYFSHDFRDHATAHLMRSLFGLHDPARFRVHAYSFGPDDGSAHRLDIAAACDRFVDVRDLGHEDAARAIHGDGVDILIDVMGCIENNRLAVPALRPAPVQATFLAFPGSTGADFFDYALVDRVVAPEGEAAFFAERLAYLPHSYQANDHRQPIADWKPTRTGQGLPEDAFVFCSFCQTYKIEPVIFDAWVEILRSAPGAALWLYRSNPWAEANLKREAEARGVAPDRLVFADSEPKDRHLARLALADLALDTRACNGHTTTSDALWAGVPVLAVKGSHFASRVSQSLLEAMEMEDMVADGLEDYVAQALRLAESPDAMQAVRERLAAKRETAPLFDTPRFVRDLETLYEGMWSAWRRGEIPPILKA